MGSERTILAILEAALTIIDHLPEIEEMIHSLDIDPNDKQALLDRIRKSRSSIKRWNEREVSVE